MNKRFRSQLYFCKRSPKCVRKICWNRKTRYSILRYFMSFLFACNLLKILFQIKIILKKILSYYIIYWLWVLVYAKLFFKLFVLPINTVKKCWIKNNKLIWIFFRDFFVSKLRYLGNCVKSFLDQLSILYLFFCLNRTAQFYKEWLRWASNDQCRFHSYICI